MKKTQWIELLACIRSTRVSFIAMIIFVALAICLFLGFSWTGHSTEYSVDNYLQENQVHDVEIICPGSVTQDTIDELSKDNRIETIQGAHFCYAAFSLDKVKYHAAIHQADTDLDKLNIVSGTMPKSSNEIAVDSIWAHNHSISIGSEITLEKSYTGILDTSSLKEETFIVTALVTYSAHACTQVVYVPSIVDGSIIDVQFYLPEDAFVLGDSYYTSILIRFNETRGLLFDDEEYRNKVDELKDAIVEKLEDITNQKDVFGSSTLAGLAHLEAAILVKDILLNLRWSLAALFLIIGFLVCYSTITRIISQQIKLIGTQKAFGFSANMLIKRYLCYTGIATFIGSIIGVALSLIIEVILVDVVARIYFIEHPIVYHDIIEAVILVLIEIVVLSLVTFFSVRRTCQYNTVDLLNGNQYTTKAPLRHFINRANAKMQSNDPINDTAKTTKSRFSTFQQIIISNCINDRKRVVSTLIAVAGSTALIVTAIMFYANITHSPSVQYNDYYHFDSFVLFDIDNSHAQEEIAHVLDDQQIDYALVNFSAGMLKGPNSTYASTRTIIKMDEDSFSRFVTLQPTYDSSGQDTSQGFWIGHAFKNFCGDEAPDSLTFICTDKTEKEFPNYQSYISYNTSYYLICDKESYERQFDCEVMANAFVISTGNTDKNELQTILSKTEGFASFFDAQSVTQRDMSTFVSIVTAISGIYLVMSIIMGFLVLLNVLIQFVDEKRRELITMNIMGYPRKDIRKMIYIDTIMLTTIGMIFGLAIGSVISYYAISSFDSISLSFIKDIYFPAWAIGIVGTGVISAIMCLIAMKRIDSFSVSDLNTLI